MLSRRSAFLLVIAARLSSKDFPSISLPLLSPKVHVSVAISRLDDAMIEMEGVEDSDLDVSGLLGWYTSTSGTGVYFCGVGLAGDASRS